MTPYIDGGIGVANVKADVDAVGVNLVDEDATVFAYQFAAGLNLDFIPPATVFVGYRYFATLDPEFEDAAGNSFDAEYHSHNAGVGIMFQF